MVRKRTFAGLLLMALLPSPAFAQSSLDGTWKIDLGTLPLSKSTLVWKLADGVYQCKSCVPSVEVKANGQDQPTPGQPYDTISVRAIDARTVEEIEKKGGQVVSDETFRVSRDGNTATDEFMNWRVSMIRVAKGPAGSHALSGSWRPVRRESISDKELIVTYRVVGETLTMSRPTGESYSAKLDGTFAAYQGNPGITGVSVKRIAANSIEQTDEFNGKPINVIRMTLAPDGRSMTIVVKDAEARTTAQFAALKQ
jgi:hypothetical protein